MKLPTPFLHYDFGQTSAGDLYFVTELVDGTDLAQIIQGAGLVPAQALDVTVQICEALHHAHSCGVIHRDIKPANVIVTRNGRAKLADFGLARPLDADETGSTVSAPATGSPAYIAPEQREGRADQRTDIYALGVLLYEMLTGERPEGFFARPSSKVLMDVRLDQVVIKALQYEPDRRYQQVTEMKTDVDRIRSTPHEAAPAEAVPARGMRTTLVALLVTVNTLSGGALWYLHKREAAGHAPEQSTTTVDSSPPKAPQTPLQVSNVQPSATTLATTTISDSPTGSAGPAKVEAPGGGQPIRDESGGSQVSADFEKYARALRESALLKLEPQVQLPSFASPLSSAEKYPWKQNIVTTNFWVGKPPGAKTSGAALASAWDMGWTRTFGGYDDPAPSARLADLRTGDFRPAKFVPQLNPFYFALPYNDLSGSHHKPEASKVIPWFREAFREDGKTVLADRWICLKNRFGKECYAQWSDCGPARTDHWQYVFGPERPKPNANKGAGLSVSPAVRDFLALTDTDVTDWRFVEWREVPPGPWRRYGENNHWLLDERYRRSRTAAPAPPDPVPTPAPAPPASGPRINVR